MALSEREAARLHVMTEKERQLYAGGVKLIGGADEAGRGPLAGPVVAACVVMPKDGLIAGVNDSKKISEGKRGRLYEEISKECLGFGIGIVGPDEIDDINILNATRKAFKMAGEALSLKPEHMLCDAISGVDFGCPSSYIVRGDTLSYSIAAASIIAKVTRDRIMIEYDEIYPQYGFARHKGYGTKQHTDALKIFGPCPIHRRTFISRFV
ncbi:MAG: ribonuclease HII [Christensenellales bacterium]|jgi:ribonuclease HII